MKRLVIAFSLACVLSPSALAGEIPSAPGAPPAPEPPAATAPGDVPSGGYVQDSSTDLTLTVVETILGLLAV